MPREGKRPLHAATKRNFRRLGFESLERREMMAGDVQVTLDRGTLIIEGDGAANGFIVRPRGDDILIDSHFEATVGDTTINGTDRVQFAARRIDKITIKTGDADALGDQVLVRDISLDRNLLIFTGNGADLVDVHRVTVEKDVRIRTAAGIDNLNVRDSEIRSGLTLRGGDDDDVLTISRSFVVGFTTMLGDAGQDTNGMFDSHLLGRTLVNVSGTVGETCDVVSCVIENLDYGLLHDSGLDIFASQITGRLKITDRGPSTTGQSVRMSFVTVLGEADITTVEGEDEITMEFCTFGSVLNVLLGADDDDFLFNNSTFAELIADGEGGTNTITDVTDATKKNNFDVPPVTNNFT